MTTVGRADAVLCRAARVRISALRSSPVAVEIVFLQVLADPYGCVAVTWQFGSNVTGLRNLNSWRKGYTSPCGDLFDSRLRRCREGWLPRLRCGIVTACARRRAFCLYSIRCARVGRLTSVTARRGVRRAHTHASRHARLTVFKDASLMNFPGYA